MGSRQAYAEKCRYGRKRCGRMQTGESFVRVSLQEANYDKIDFSGSTAFGMK
jgi:hypothetical protein